MTNEIDKEIRKIAGHVERARPDEPEPSWFSIPDLMGWVLTFFFGFALYVLFTNFFGASTPAAPITPLAPAASGVESKPAPGGFTERVGTKVSETEKKVLRKLLGGERH